MDEDMTLLIDPETRDLVFDEGGNFVKIYGAVKPASVRPHSFGFAITLSPPIRWSRR